MTFVKFEQFVFENPTHHTSYVSPCSQIISVKSVKSVFENPTHHAMTLFSVASEPYPLNSCNPCSKKPTHHASISIYAFPKNKIRAIRVIRVQENNPSRININFRVPPK